jgi:hypothetical protein
MSQTRMSELAAAEAAEKTAILVYNEQAKLQAKSSWPALQHGVAVDHRLMTTERRASAQHRQLG